MTIKSFYSKPSTRQKAAKKWVDKLLHFQSLSPEEMIHLLTDLMYKVLLMAGIPYFLFVLIQFIISKH
ncbi:hypothetical protein PU629_14230 [Pullulanibacillus sp. KACC 23026]|uniref:hypothetical protein n=1 Tax=Pullulanibacillus sp. KACC 23026 TaxID=3028315 RepID=UPI0023AF5ACF|nr:hypothetical protein [Pullulanibacillus sp. KACC 23026]WEG11318.1 hypothetical protein PU629_14230 [Pullulanibacillus sp. KACC 23026]